MRIKYQGFSLLEMMLALSLMAILVLMALPNQAMFVHDHESKVLARQVMQALEMARQESVLRGKPIDFCLSLDRSHCEYSGRYALVFAEGFIIESLDLGEDAKSLVWHAAFHQKNLRWYPDGNDGEIKGSFQYHDPQSQNIAWEIDIGTNGRIRYQDFKKGLRIS